MKRYPNAHDALCSVPDCRSKLHAKGMCVTHYNADYRSRNDNPMRDTHPGVIRGPNGIPKGWGAL